MSIRRDPVLDGVRGVAILLVFAGHTTPALLAGGRIGVDLFFVLSGFLITSILLNEYRE
ncbi:MAG TPA: acyltransferase family protein, partial [Patescibacteria group bacterium]|nr:acyltransferase family protein [Patescibacteria group bacterium]